VGRAASQILRRISAGREVNFGNVVAGVNGSVESMLESIGVLGIIGKDKSEVLDMTI
jgi:hypothetical protein